MIKAVVFFFCVCSIFEVKAQLQTYLNDVTPATITANPNPANTWVTFEYGLPVTANGAELIVSDMQGKLVVSFRLAGPTGQQVWDTRPVEKGIYVYTLIAGGTSKQGKLVIQ